MEYNFHLLMIIIFAYFLFYIRNYIRCLILAAKLKGPPALPILGNVSLINEFKQFNNLCTHAYQMYGSLMRVWISIIPFICIYEPKHLKVILGSKCSQKNVFYTVLHNVVGSGLITNNGMEWKTHRKLIQPYFHIHVLEKYINTFSENAKDMINALEGVTDVKITSFINQCVLGILHKAVLGVTLEPDDKESPYRMGDKLVINQRITKPWLLLKTIFDFTPFAKSEKQQKMNLHNYTRKVLLQRRKEPESSPKSLLDMFIEISENNKNFTDEDIINEAVTFMLAGQDSVGGAVAFSLYYLAKYQDIQEIVKKELDDIHPINDSFTLEDLSKMKYLEQCIKESLRLTPTIPVISRVLTEDVVLDGYTLPVGTNIFISPYVTHRLPHVFPDPLKFDPNRFSEENSGKIHPFAFIPFSMGYRNCIGYKFAYLEMKTIIASILNRYKISLLPGHENYETSYKVTLKARGGIWIHLEPRIKTI